jgi:AcrR family transcriptional regulator
MPPGKPAPSRVGKPRTRKAREPLSRDRIVAEALAFADAQGLDMLTTRALAGKLGVEAMALYHHFPSKDALLDALTERLEREATPEQRNGPWQQRLLDMARTQVAVLRTHPRLAPLMTARRGTTNAVFANNEIVLACLEEAGLKGALRVTWLRIIASFINGMGLYIAARTDPGTNSAVPDAASFPLLTEAMKDGRTVDTERALETGMAAISTAIMAASR